MNKLFTTILTAALLAAPAAQAAQLRAGTPVSVKAVDRLHADELKTGDRVSFRTRRPVNCTDGTVCIPYNARITGQVTKKKNNFIFGVPGYLETGNFSVEVGGARAEVPLDGDITARGNNRYGMVGAGLAGAVFIAIPIVLVFAKGGDGVIEPGQEFLLYVLDDTEVE